MTGAIADRNPHSSPWPPPAKGRPVLLESRFAVVLQPGERVAEIVVMGVAGYGAQVGPDGRELIVRHVLELGPGHDLQQAAIHRRTVAVVLIVHQSVESEFDRRSAVRCPFRQDSRSSRNTSWARDSQRPRNTSGETPPRLTSGSNEPRPSRRADADLAEGARDLRAAARCTRQNLRWMLH